MITPIAGPKIEVLERPDQSTGQAGKGAPEPAPTAVVAEDAAKQLKADQAEDVNATDELKKAVPLPDVHQRELSMRVSPETNRVVIQVIDSETKAVVRQIPPEEALDLLRLLPKQRAVFVDREG